MPPASGSSSPTASSTGCGQPDRDGHLLPPLNGPQGILPLEPGPDASGFVVVDATLRVTHHPRIVVGPVDVKAFVEYRLVDGMRP